MSEAAEPVRTKGRARSAVGSVHQTIQPLTARASLAMRVALLTTAAVAVTLAAVSALVFVTVRAEFESSLDESMLRRANAAVTADYTPSAEELDVAGIKIFIVRGGQIFSRRGAPPCP